jgi:hypothetical protein
MGERGFFPYDRDRFDDYERDHGLHGRECFDFEGLVMRARHQTGRLDGNLEDTAVTLGLSRFALDRLLRRFESAGVVRVERTRRSGEGGIEFVDYAFLHPKSGLAKRLASSDSAPPSSGPRAGVVRASCGHRADSHEEPADDQERRTRRQEDRKTGRQEDARQGSTRVRPSRARARGRGRASPASATAAEQVGGIDTSNGQEPVALRDAARDLLTDLDARRGDR